jgi:hypothetical protein
MEALCGGLEYTVTLGVGQRPTRRLQERSRDPPVKNS